jgi:translation initiation factor IF-3
VRVITADGEQLGILPIGEALRIAAERELDLVEVAPEAAPPVCRIMDFGKFKYQQSRRAKDARKKQTIIQVKEVKMGPKTDEHDFQFKARHVRRFLEEGNKAKVTIRFRGREMAHTEFGFQVVNRFITQSAPYGHPDAAPKLVGRSINVMLSPLPRNKRAKNPHAMDGSAATLPDTHEPLVKVLPSPASVSVKPESASPKSVVSGFSNNPFDKLDLALNQTGGSESVSGG